MWAYVAILIGLYLLQSLMTYRQMKAFQCEILSLRNQGITGLGVKKGALRPGKVVFLVSNRQGQIIAARSMSGYSVFARFRKRNEWEGLDVLHFPLQKAKGKREREAVQQALIQIRAKLTLPLSNH